ncbi:tripartite tricarboxylate transporter TctB family protein [Nonomuraea phyllanthi]|nr:tripartite tricarboxylate transporter TctB family protein [Nonomuraea phyllanthi]
MKGSKAGAVPVRETLIASGALVLAAAALLSSRAIEPAVRSHDIGPAAWPTVLAACMGVLALVMLARAVSEAARRRQADAAGASAGADAVEEVAAGGPAKVLTALAAFVVYGAAWHLLDFRVCTPLLLAALAAIGGGRGWRPLVAYPIGLTALLWLLFGYLLEVPL